MRRPDAVYVLGGLQAIRASSIRSTKANGTDIAFDLIVDSPGGFAKLQAGASREVDLVSTDMPWVTRMGPAGLALELNPDDYADVYATFYDQFKPPFEPLLTDGKTIGVATRWGWVGRLHAHTDITSPRRVENL